MPANGTDLVAASSGAETQWHMSELIIHPQLNSLMLSHTFLILLFPLIISLFHFSTPQARRRPIFILNLAAIFLAFVVGVLLDVLSVSRESPSIATRIESLMVLHRSIQYWTL